MALVGMEAVSPWLRIGTNLLCGHVACGAIGPVEEADGNRIHFRSAILPLFAEKPLAVCTKRKSSFFTALPWVTSDLQVSLEGVVGGGKQVVQQVAALFNRRTHLSFPVTVY